MRKYPDDIGENMSTSVCAVLPLLLSLFFCCSAGAAASHTPHGVAPGFAVAATSEAADAAGAPSAASAPSALEAFADLKGMLHISGGSIHVPVMVDAASKIMAQYPDVIITIAGGGSELGVQQVTAGQVNIGSSGRPLTVAEKKQVGLVEFPFAIDALAVVVHPANGLKSLTWQQLAAIYAGEITQWKDVGGPDIPINVYSREVGTGTKQCFIDNALKGGSIIDTANVLSSNGDMKMSVAQNPSAIGFLSVGYADASVKVLALGEVAPIPRKILTKAYPVVRQLYMDTKGEPQGLTKAFIDYIYSPQGAEAIRRSGYIPLQRQPQPQSSS